MDTLLIQNARGVTIAKRDFLGNGGGLAIRIERGEGVVIEQCNFRHLSQAISCLYVKNVVVRDCVFEACDDGLPLTDKGTQWIPAKDVEFYGCENAIAQRLVFFNKLGARGIVPWGPCRNITIADCTFRDMGKAEPAKADAGAIYADGAHGESDPVGLIVRNNRIEYPNGSAVYIDGPADGINLWTQVRVINNTIQNCREPWRMWCDQSIVSGNIVTRCKEKGLARPTVQLIKNNIDGKVAA